MDPIDLEFQQIVEAASSTDSSPVSVASVENSGPSEVELISQEIAQLEFKINSFADAYIKPLDEIIDHAVKQQEEILKAAQEAVNKLSQERMEAQTKKNSLAQELRDLENKLRALGIDKNKLLEAEAAKQKLVMLAQSLKEVWESMPWFSAMKDYQNEDIMFILQAWDEGKSGVLNANDRGLGKTFETAAALDLLTILFIKKYDRMPRVLWLTKKGIVGQTFRENLRWNPNRKQIVLGMSKMVEGPLYTSIIMGANKDTRDFQLDMAIQTNSWVLTNYDALNTTTRLVDVDWDFVVVDEVQKLKGGANCQSSSCDHSTTAKNCKATGLWRKTKQIVEKPNTFFMPLSGSPIENHPRDMWAYLHLFRPKSFPSVGRFEREYCWGYGVEGYKVDFDQLITTMSDQVIRRNKNEVALNLPDKIVEYDIDELVGDQLALYSQMRDEFFVHLDSMGDKSLTVTAIIAQLSYLRQINIWPGGVEKKMEDGTSVKLPDTNSSKLERAMEQIEQLVAEGEQVVVFSTFNKPLVELAKRINNSGWEFNSSGKKVVAATFTGEDNSGSSGEETLNEFQQGNVHVLCANIIAGGEGLNLQKSDQWPGGSSNAIMLDVWWNPSKMLQAEDRLHRTGQKDTVNITYLQCENTVDVFMAKILTEKQEMMEGIMEDEKIRPAIEWKSILQELI